MLIAITRQVSRSILQCELTHLERVPINLEVARRQHAAYETALRSLGLQVISLAEEPALPDSVFIEDAALVLDECALLTRPGAESRRAEVESCAAALAPWRMLYRLEAPATLDGGDILVVGRSIFVGMSARSNPQAVVQMQGHLARYGYRVFPVPVRGCLHLKSAVTQVSDDTLLINPRWVDRMHFPGMKFIEIDPAEPYAANALLVNGTVLYQPAFPHTLEILESNGLKVMPVDASELGKAEGALTCCSLLFKK